MFFPKEYVQFCPGSYNDAVDSEIILWRINIWSNKYTVVQVGPVARSGRRDGRDAMLRAASSRALQVHKR